MPKNKRASLGDVQMLKNASTQWVPAFEFLPLLASWSGVEIRSRTREKAGQRVEHKIHRFLVDFFFKPIEETNLQIDGLINELIN